MRIVSKICKLDRHPYYCRYLEEVLGRVFDRLLLGRCFRGFVLLVFEYSTGLQCGAFKLLGRVVSGSVAKPNKFFFEIKTDKKHRPIYIYTYILI